MVVRDECIKISGGLITISGKCWETDIVSENILVHKFYKFLTCLIFTTEIVCSDI